MADSDEGGGGWRTRTMRDEEGDTDYIEIYIYSTSHGQQKEKLLGRREKYI